MSATAPNQLPQVVVVLLVIVGFLVVVAGLADLDGDGPAAGPGASAPSEPPAEPPRAERPRAQQPQAGAAPRAPTALPGRIPDALPGGGQQVFGRNRFLVAYYGTAGSAVRGVLGEAGPDAILPRVRAAGRPFRRQGERIQPVYELIVTVADGIPGPDGDYSHDISPARVARYVRAAQRNRVLLLLDVQPGRAGFLEVARRWQWALRHPWVGLALDPEWRMHGRQVPGRRVGWVSDEEVNRTSAWLARLVRRHDLPEKPLVLHQFRTSMVRDLPRVRDRPGLALVQHADGFGTPGQKRATYAALARQSRLVRERYTMGLKLFYDEDRPRMRAAAVRDLRPPVRFVSFQ